MRDQFPARRISKKEITDETEKCTVGVEKAGGNVEATRDEYTKVGKSLAELYKRRVTRSRRNLRKLKRRGKYHEVTSEKMEKLRKMWTYE